MVIHQDAYKEYWRCFSSFLQVGGVINVDAENSIINQLLIALELILLFGTGAYITILVYSVSESFATKRAIRERIERLKEPITLNLDEEEQETEEEEPMVGCSSLTPKWADVWVRAYIDPDAPELGMVNFKEILFHGNLRTHRWGWIESKSSYGWIENMRIIRRKPAKPLFYASSEDAMHEAERILQEYNHREVPTIKQCVK